MGNKLNYERDLAIDETALDLEWLQQPLLMLDYTEAAASARREVDRTKEKLSVLRAELGKKVRKHPEHYDIAKITVDAVEAAIITTEEYSELANDMIDAQYEYQMLQGAVQAVEQRKQALENMTKLLGLQYFASPKAPRDLPYEVEQEMKKEKSNNAITIKRKK